QDLSPKTSNNQKCDCCRLQGFLPFHLLPLQEINIHIFPGDSFVPSSGLPKQEILPRLRSPKPEITRPRIRRRLDVADDTHRNRLPITDRGFIPVTDQCLNLIGSLIVRAQQSRAASLYGCQYGNQDNRHHLLHHELLSL